MRGEVLHYDSGQGLGFISGDDGSRYAFERGDLRQMTPIARAMRVDFRADSGRAREIFRVRGGKPAGGAPAFGRPVMVHDEDAPGIWGHFRACITRDYANLRDRAPRKEFWSFTLFTLLGVAVAAAAGLGLDSLAGNLDPGSMPILAFALPCIFLVAMIVPAVAVTVRRQHDIGLSGWFVLLTLIPSLGSLILLAFALIPTQRHDNRWGPVPESAAA